jgi:hypothetical protein
LNNAVSPRAVSTTAKVRRVSPPIGVNDAGTRSSPSADRTCSPVTPPANPITRTSAPIARNVRATFSPLPPDPGPDRGWPVDARPVDARHVMRHIESRVERDDEDHCDLPGSALG